MSSVTKESDAYDWYVQNMQPVTDGAVYEYQGKYWTLRYEYRYANYMYGFFCSEDDQWTIDIINMNDIPRKFTTNMGIYSSYQALLVGLVHRYVDLIRSVT